MFLACVCVTFSSHRQSGTGSLVVTASCATSLLSQITSKTKNEYREVTERMTMAVVVVTRLAREDLENYSCCSQLAKQGTDQVRAVRRMPAVVLSWLRLPVQFDMNKTFWCHFTGPQARISEGPRPAQVFTLNKTSAVHRLISVVPQGVSQSLFSKSVAALGCVFVPLFLMDSLLLRTERSRAVALAGGRVSVEQ